MDGKVYDIIEWAGCQHVGISPDTHRVPYHISFGSRMLGTSKQQRATPDAPPADLLDFLSQIFQVPPGQVSNGNFFAAPQQGPGATAASKPNSTVPKGEAKPKWGKKMRRPFQRWHPLSLHKSVSGSQKGCVQRRMEFDLFIFKYLKKGKF